MGKKKGVERRRGGGVEKERRGGGEKDIGVGSFFKRGGGEI